MSYAIDAHSCECYPIRNMKALWILLLATVTSARTPMSQQQWIKFVETPVPQYDVNENENSQPELISAKYIDVRKPPAKMSEMV